MGFKESLKNLRTEKNLNQSDLADALNMTSGAIGMYETGKREPDLDTLVQIANYFGVTTDNLLDINNNDEPLSDIELFYINLGEKIKQLRKANNIKQDELAEVLDLTRTSVVNIEKGHQRILTHTLVKIAAKFNVDIGDLVSFGVTNSNYIDLLSEPEKQAFLNVIEKLKKENII